MSTPLQIGQKVKVSTNQDRQIGDEIPIADNQTQQVINIGRVIELIVVAGTIIGVIAQIIK
jgi:hypothetical protein